MRSRVIVSGAKPIAPHAPVILSSGAPINPSDAGVLLVGGGSGGGWPAALDTGLRFRFDASDLASLTLSGSDVTAWADLGPDSLDLTHENLGFPNPTYTATGFAGGPAVRFKQDASIASDALSRSGVAGDFSGTNTYAIVYEPQETVSSFSTVLVHSTAGGSGFVLREDDSFSVACSNASYGSPQARAATPPKTPQVIVISIGPSVATYERNGAVVTTTSVPGTGPSITGKLSLGANTVVGNRSCKYIALAVRWNRALSAGDKADLYAYCASVWAT